MISLIISFLLASIVLVGGTYVPFKNAPIGWKSSIHSVLISDASINYTLYAQSVLRKQKTDGTRTLLYFALYNHATEKSLENFVSIDGVNTALYLLDVKFDETTSTAVCLSAISTETAVPFLWTTSYTVAHIDFDIIRDENRLEIGTPEVLVDTNSPNKSLPTAPYLHMSLAPVPSYLYYADVMGGVSAFDIDSAITSIQSGLEDTFGHSKHYSSHSSLRRTQHAANMYLRPQYVSGPGYLTSQSHIVSIDDEGIHLASWPSYEPKGSFATPPRALLTPPRPDLSEDAFEITRETTGDDVINTPSRRRRMNDIPNTSVPSHGVTANITILSRDLENSYTIQCPIAPGPGSDVLDLFVTASIDVVLGARLDKFSGAFAPPYTTFVCQTKLEVFSVTTKHRYDAISLSTAEEVQSAGAFARTPEEACKCPHALSVRYGKETVSPSDPSHPLKEYMSVVVSDGHKMLHFVAFDYTLQKFGHIIPMIYIAEPGDALAAVEIFKRPNENPYPATSVTMHHGIALVTYGGIHISGSIQGFVPLGCGDASTPCDVTDFSAKFDLNSANLLWRPVPFPTTTAGTGVSTRLYMNQDTTRAWFLMAETTPIPNATLHVDEAFAYAAPKHEVSAAAGADMRLVRAELWSLPLEDAGYVNTTTGGQVPFTRRPLLLWATRSSAPSSDPSKAHYLLPLEALCYDETEEKIAFLGIADPFRDVEEPVTPIQDITTKYDLISRAVVMTVLNDSDLSDVGITAHLPETTESQWATTGMYCLRDSSLITMGSLQYSMDSKTQSSESSTETVTTRTLTFDYEMLFGQSFHNTETESYTHISASGPDSHSTTVRTTITSVEHGAKSTEETYETAYTGAPNWFTSSVLTNTRFLTLDQGYVHSLGARLRGGSVGFCAHSTKSAKEPVSTEAYSNYFASSPMTHRNNTAEIHCTLFTDFANNQPMELITKYESDSYPTPAAVEMGIARSYGVFVDALHSIPYSAQLQALISSDTTPTPESATVPTGSPLDVGATYTPPFTTTTTALVGDLLGFDRRGFATLHRALDAARLDEWDLTALAEQLPAPVDPSDFPACTKVSGRVFAARNTDTFDPAKAPTVAPRRFLLYADEPEAGGAACLISYTAEIVAKDDHVGTLVDGHFVGGEYTTEFVLHKAVDITSALHVSPWDHSPSDSHHRRRLEAIGSVVFQPLVQSPSRASNWTDVFVFDPTREQLLLYRADGVRVSIDSDTLTLSSVDSSTLIPSNFTSISRPFGYDDAAGIPLVSSDIWVGPLFDPRWLLPATNVIPSGDLVCPAGTYVDYSEVDPVQRVSIPVCEPCPMGYYSNTKNAPYCVLCPEGQSTAKVGSTKCIECPIQDTCVDGHMCIAGYKMPMCKYCDDAHFQVFHQCLPCEGKKNVSDTGKWQRGVNLIAVIVFVIAFVCVYNYFTDKSFFVLFYAFFATFQFIQTIGFLSHINTVWPGVVQNILNFYSGLLFKSDSPLSGCGNPTPSFYYPIRWAFTVLFPILSFLMVLAFKFNLFRHCIFSRYPHRIRTRFMRTFSLMASLSFGYALHRLAEAFDCSTETSEVHLTYLHADHTIHCNSERHKLLAQASMVFLAIFLLVSAAFFIWTFLWSRRNTDKSGLTFRDRYPHLDAIYLRLRSDCLWFDGFRLVVLSILAIVSVVAKHSATTATIILFAVLMIQTVVYFVVHPSQPWTVRTWPSESREFSRHSIYILEAVHVTCLTLAYVFAVIMASAKQDSSSGLKHAFGGLFIAVNALGWLVSLVSFGIASPTSASLSASDDRAGDRGHGSRTGRFSSFVGMMNPVRGKTGASDNDVENDLEGEKVASKEPEKDASSRASVQMVSLARRVANSLQRTSQAPVPQQHLQHQQQQETRVVANPIAAVNTMLRPSSVRASHQSGASRGNPSELGSEDLPGSVVHV